ncbi:MAG: four helix bundle protein [Candidatus Magasanikbacteria bacterium]|nr:four helix bundle protein [Candidatus Magasanikbacteria bacterium]
MEEAYIKLGDLQVYKMAVDLSDRAWEIYVKLGWENKKVIGFQFVRAVDSVPANIAEGYGRYHYLDRIKFYYNSRGSLLETKHWILSLYKRKMIDKNNYDTFLAKANELHWELNKYIKSCYPKNRIVR